MEHPPTVLDRDDLRARALEDEPSFSLGPAIIVRALPDSASAESIHALRSHLVARHLQEGRRGLAICETEGSGGGFVGVNVAVSLADAGVRTLLIDTDVREPRLDGFIRPSRPLLGLADIMEQLEVPVGSAVQAVLPNLSLLYAGLRRESALDLLGTPRFAKLVDLCMREFDFTIALTAPANRFSDGRRVASVLRHAMIVTRKDVTFTQDIHILVQELVSDHVSVIGTVYQAF